MAETEASVWASAHLTQSDMDEDGLLPSILPIIVATPVGPKCFVDESWTDTYDFSGAGWIYSSGANADRLMGAKNFRRNLSPLNDELEALIWAIQCMLVHKKMNATFLTDCTELIKMVTTLHEFAVQLEDFERCKEAFTRF